jgi:hypothetical protein
MSASNTRCRNWGRAYPGMPGTTDIKQIRGLSRRLIIHVVDRLWSEAPGALTRRHMTLPLDADRDETLRQGRWRFP